jgi:predicted DNA-binding transcriptional regulator AlpA
MAATQMRGEMEDNTMYEELNYLPQMLNAKELQELLGISQSSTYDLMHREDFPTLRINARLMVSRSNLIKWLTEHTDGAGNIDG